MRVFVTGATGFIGSAVVRELLDHGHKVLGLARSDEGAQKLKAAGADVHRGSLEDFDSLRSGAAAADAVAHLAFIHDFHNYGRVTGIDKLAIETIGEVLRGSDRPLAVTSGTLLIDRRGPLATEADSPVATFPRKSEDAANALATQGVRAMTVRLPPSVHGDGDHGFVPMLGKLAREKAASAYIGDGQNRWPAVHRLDAAKVYRLALEKGTAGATYHAVGDEGVPFRKIAEAISRQVGVPLVSKKKEEAEPHFGWFSMFVGVDCPASSEKTRQQLEWNPTLPGLIHDIDRPQYFGR